MRRALRGLVSTALPSLRVVALVYAGISGIAVLVVVVTAAVTPKAPVLQQVTEPAREAVTTLVQPTTNMVTGIMASPPPPAPTVATAPEPPLFVDMTTLDVVIDNPAPTPEPVVVQRPQLRAVYVAPAAPAVTADEASADDQSVDDAVAEDVPASSNDQVVSAPQDAPALQEAAAEAPKALPTPTVVIPTTPEQVKAQVDAANQAAIDAAKTATATAKAQADVANQAAIDAARQSSAPALSDAAITLPTPTLTAKQSAETARLEAEKQKAEADAANQAAIDAARALAKKH